MPGNIRLAVDDEGKLTIAFGSKSRTKEHWGSKLIKKRKGKLHSLYPLHLTQFVSSSEYPQFGCNATKYKEIQRDTRTEESFFKLRFFCLNFQQFIHASQRSTETCFCVIFYNLFKCIPKVHRLYCRASLIEHIFDPNELWWDNRIKIGKKS